MKKFSFLIFYLWTLFSPLYSQQKITLLFAGDLMQHQAQIDAAANEGKYDYSDCFKYVKQEIEKADVAVANLEVTLGGKPYRGYPAFSAPDEYLHAIKEAGFDILVTANNHCLDRGRKGLERTVKMLDSLQIPYVGTYTNLSQRESRYPLLIEKNGFRIVLLSYTYGTNGIKTEAPSIVNYIDKEKMSKDIRKARMMRPDVIIAFMHWGSEYKSTPDVAQKELAEWMIGLGVDHVIGSHPHVLQPMELRTNANTLSKNVVVYSLGNFFSNMSVKGTDGGAMCKLELRKFNGIVRVIDCGYSLVWTSRPVLSGKKAFLLYPAANPPDSISPSEKQRMHMFVDNSRKLFKAYNKEVSEYIF